MASNLSKYIISLPVHGLNDTDDDSLIDNKQVSYARNVDFKKDGFGVRKGYTKYNSFNFGVNKISSILEYQKDGVKTLLAVSNNTLKKQTSSSTWSDIGVLASCDVEGININCTFNANPSNDKLLILDGSDYKYYDGTTFASVPFYDPTVEEETAIGQNILETTPNEIKQAKFIQSYMNRVWITKGRTLRFSDTQTGGGHVGNYFPATFVFSIPLDITGFVVGSKPIVFTDQKPYVIKGNTADSSGYDPYRYEDIESDAGCSSHRSIAVTNKGIIWLHRKGVYRLNEGDYYSVDKISKGQGIKSGGKIQKFIDSKTDTQIKEAFAVVGNDKYLLIFNDGTSVVFDLIEENWTIYDSLKGDCGINFEDNVLLASDYVYKLFDGLNDDGVAIIAEVHGKNSNLDEQTINKDFDSWVINVRSDLNTYTLYPSYEMDGIEITDTSPVTVRISKWGEFLFGDRIRTVDVTLNKSMYIQKGDERHSFKWKLKSIDLNHQWQVIGQFLNYKARELSS